VYRITEAGSLHERNAAPPRNQDDGAGNPPLIHVGAQTTIGPSSVVPCSIQEAHACMYADESLDLTTPMDSGRIAARWQGRYPRCANRENAGSA